jgi:hypothetical protein
VPGTVEVARTTRYDHHKEEIMSVYRAKGGKRFRVCDQVNCNKAFSVVSTEHVPPGWKRIANDMMMVCPECYAEMNPPKPYAYACSYDPGFYSPSVVDAIKRDQEMNREIEERLRADAIKREQAKRTCETCQYGIHINLAERPCSSCGPYHNWRPRESAPPTMQVTPPDGARVIVTGIDCEGRVEVKFKTDPPKGRFPSDLKGKPIQWRYSPSTAWHEAVVKDIFDDGMVALCQAREPIYPASSFLKLTTEEWRLPPDPPKTCGNCGHQQMVQTVRGNVTAITPVCDKTRSVPHQDDTCKDWIPKSPDPKTCATCVSGHHLTSALCGACINGDSWIAKTCGNCGRWWEFKEKIDGTTEGWCFRGNAFASPTGICDLWTPRKP